MTDAKAQLWQEGIKQVYSFTISFDKKSTVCTGMDAPLVRGEGWGGGGGMGFLGGGEGGEETA